MQFSLDPLSSYLVDPVFNHVQGVTIHIWSLIVYLIYTRTKKKVCTWLDGYWQI